MSYDLEKSSRDVEVKDIVDIPVEVEKIADMPDTFEVEKGVASVVPQNLPPSFHLSTKSIVLRIHL